MAGPRVPCQYWEALSIPDDGEARFLGQGREGEGQGGEDYQRFPDHLVTSFGIPSMFNHPHWIDWNPARYDRWGEDIGLAPHGQPVGGLGKDL